jgi:hypothetical protein
MALAAIVGGFAARCVAVARADAITCDEATHLVHCLHFWMTGDDLAMWELGAPRLPHALGALASYAALEPAGLLPTERGADLEPALERLVLSGADRVVVPARLVAIGWGCLLLVLVFDAGRRARGPLVGLVAAGLLSLLPEMLAHSAIAGSDMPFTAAAFLALVQIGRYAERPTRGRWVGVALAIGLAWAMRHSALVLLPVAGLVHLAWNLRRQRPGTFSDAAECIFGSVWAGAGLTAIAMAVLWAGDGFQTLSLAQVSSKVTTIRLPEALGSGDLSAVPVPASVLSILKQIRHQNAGHEAYFLGETGRTGWSWYFPVAFALKTPLALLGLLALAVARVRPEGRTDAILLLFLGVLWTMLVRNKVDIGLRYALLTYPIAMLFIARMFAGPLRRDRVWGPASVLLAGWLAVASFGCGGRFLSYFNEAGGGPALGWLYLVDSNVDWGQDVDATAAAIAALGITEVTTDLHSERTLEIPGVLVVRNPGKALQVPAATPPNRRLYDADGGWIPIFTRYVAVSVTRLMGLYSQNDMSYLRTRKLVARVGDSVLIFDMDTPADAPLDVAAARVGGPGGQGPARVPAALSLVNLAR